MPLENPSPWGYRIFSYKHYIHEYILTLPSPNQFEQFKTNPIKLQSFVELQVVKPTKSTDSNRYYAAANKGEMVNLFEAHLGG